MGSGSIWDLPIAPEYSHPIKGLVEQYAEEMKIKNPHFSMGLDTGFGMLLGNSDDWAKDLSCEGGPVPYLHPAVSEVEKDWFDKYVVEKGDPFVSNLIEGEWVLDDIDEKERGIYVEENYGSRCGEFEFELSGDYYLGVWELSGWEMVEKMVVAISVGNLDSMIKEREMEFYEREPEILFGLYRAYLNHVGSVVGSAEESLVELGDAMNLVSVRLSNLGGV